MTSSIFDQTTFINAIVNEYFQDNNRFWNPIFTRHYENVIGFNTKKEKEISKKLLLNVYLYNYLLNIVDDAIIARYRDIEDEYNSNADTDSETEYI
jgi:hypothetical protein